ncbi:MAG: PKD domain-containing protein [Microthrixaceae bacterium]
MSLKNRLAPLALAVGILSLVSACVQEPGPPANLVPNAVFLPSVSTGVAPLPVDFDASNSADPDGTIVAWNWNFGDFTTGAGEQVSHTFTAPGSYTVKLTVTDNKGATGSSTTVITVSGKPAAPTGLTKVGSGCCNTYGDFSWNAVPGATAYEVLMDGQVGCITDHSATFPGTATSGRVQAIGLCLGSKYNVTIRAQANGLWSDWSPVLNITL